MTLTPVAYIPAWYPSTGGTLDLDGGDLFGLKKLKAVQHSCHVLPAGGRDGQKRKPELVALDDPEQFHGRLGGGRVRLLEHLSLIHISEPTRLGMISYAVFCLKKKKKKKK